MRRFITWFFGIVFVCAGAFAVTWALWMPDANQRGVWLSQTGGMVLELDYLQAKAYRQSSVSCLETIAFPAHMKLIELIEGARIETVGAQLNLHIDGALEPTTFNKLDALPEGCMKADPAAATADGTFIAFWTAMNEHYAFFDLHGVTWAERAALAPAPDATDAELREAMLAATAGLDDGHVHFGTDGHWSSPAEPPAWTVGHDGLSREYLFRTAQHASGADLFRHGTAPILFGMRDDGVGYIQILAMDVNRAIGQSSLHAATRAFTEVLEDLEDAKALIIDVRYNPGGSDSVAFGFASHFTDVAVPVFTKTTRDGDGQSAPFAAVLEPHEGATFDKSVIVLTSGMTGSAAEIFTLAMREIPHVTIMGEPTSGGLSDVLGFTLPNGWSLGLSNQTYTAADGNVYEAVGIPPDAPVTFDGAALAAGQDGVLAAAIAVAGR